MPTIQNNYGTGYFQIYTNVSPTPVKIIDGNGLNYELDLSDRDQDERENIALDGTRYIKLRGEYVNPKITIHYPKTDLQTALLAARGTTIQFTPYNDNASFMNLCNLVSFTPIFDENTATLIKLEIILKSVNYWTWTPTSV